MPGARFAKVVPDTHVTEVPEVVTFDACPYPMILFPETTFPSEKLNTRFPWPVKMLSLIVPFVATVEPVNPIAAPLAQKLLNRLF
jgi:hypothetical protein